MRESIQSPKYICIKCTIYGINKKITERKKPCGLNYLTDTGYSLVVRSAGIISTNEI